MSLVTHTHSAKTKAVLFDAFPIFDPKPVYALVNELFPAKGSEISNLWRTRQFEYTWLRTCGHRYRDFWQVTEDALVFAAASLEVDLTREARARLMSEFLNLKPHPDVRDTLQALKAKGIKTGFLSNFTPRMLESSAKSSGIDHLLDYTISTDEARTFKPDPRAYELGLHATGFKREEIVFVAFASWDAVGAAWFGYPTYWANRQHQRLDNLDVAPTATGFDLSGLETLVR